MAAPRRYVIRLDVEVRDQDDPARLQRDTVTERCLQMSRQVAGGSDGEALCNLFRLGMREGWVMEEQIAAIVGGALTTKRKARRCGR